MIKGMRICEKHKQLWKMLKTNKNMFIQNYSMEFMILRVIMCITL